MEDSNYFLKNLGLETFIGHDALPRMGINNLDYSALHESKMQAEKPSETTSQRIKDETCEKQEANEEAGQIATHVQADDFFSSLELQSSSKTSSNVIAVNFSHKSTGGIVTRSRSHASTLHETNKPCEKRFSDLKARKLNKVRIKKKKNEKLCLKRKIKSKGRTRKVQIGKKVSSDSKDKVCILPESKKQNSNKLSENILEKGLGAEKNKDEDDWVLFSHLQPKKETEEKMFENKQSLMSEGQNPARRCTPEFLSINSILMSDTMSEGKDEVDKLLEVDDYDDSFLEEMEDFNYAPPRSHTGGKWKPGCLSIRTSPMLWQSQNWDALLDDEEKKSRVETSVDSLEPSGEKAKLPPTSSTTGKLKSCVPPATHTGGKWKPMTPPATHTGGKWKPLTPPSSFTGGKWKPLETGRPKKCDQDFISPDNAGHNWKCQDEAEPPINHTGGKWKPGPNHSTELWKNESAGSILTRNHTGGKWVSGKNSITRSTLDVLASCQSAPGKCLKTAGGMIQYYCSPCNRRLSSKKMYNKHVQSELHFKRLLQENELEFDSRSLKLYRGLFTQSNYKERGLGKRIIKKPEIFQDTISGNPKKERKISAIDKIKKRVVRREIIRCEVCKIKMPRHQLGKHLVSYYHSRRIHLNDPDQQKLILDNIHAIVRQAPYQCGICKFYCNTHKLFKKHWALEIHKEVEKHKNHRFWCALCSFECETSRSMELHLDSNSHREVILAVNKSIPIIIRHKVIFNCRLCFKEFRFNRELNQHERIFHKITENDTCNKFLCSICQQNCKSLKSLQRHILHSHKDASKLLYFCTSCNEFFDSAEEAKNHRRSQLHKCKSLTGENNAKKILSRACSYCGKTAANISELKIHLFENHSGLLPKCIKCGEVFALSQEVSSHVKNKECNFARKTSQASSGSFSCEKCTYSTNLKSEYLLHVAIHEKKRDDKKISCPLCGSAFTQSVLSVHLKAHLKEMIYQCSLCSKTFRRKDRYVCHLKSKCCVEGDMEYCDRKETKENKEKSTDSENKEKQILATQKAEVKIEKKHRTRIEKRQVCGDAKCKYVAKDLNDLEKHSLFHIGPKTYQCPNCPYSAKTSTIIKRHYLIHLDERSFPCNLCPFKARLKSHLKRHMRLHTGAKPFKCPHCSYSCNILENLRKHVLYTKIHPGKKLYECKLCAFDTNVSKDFKSHLSNNHKNDCRSKEANEAAGIYKKEEDLKNILTPLSVKARVSATKPLKMTCSAKLEKKAKMLAEKLSPIAPKLAFTDQKHISPCSNIKMVGNSVEDKRKILKMELEKLKNQIKPAVKKALRSYPSPAEKELRMKISAEQNESQATAVKKNFSKDELANTENASSQVKDEENGVLLLNVLPSPAEEAFSKAAKDNDITVQQMQFSSAYILYENVLPSEEMELYLLEDYHI